MELTHVPMRRATDMAWEHISRRELVGADPVQIVVYLALNALADRLAAAGERFVDASSAELAVLCAYEAPVVRVACVGLDHRGLLAKTGDDRWTLGPGHTRGYYAT